MKKMKGPPYSKRFLHEMAAAYYVFGLFGQWQTQYREVGLHSCHCWHQSFSSLGSVPGDMVGIVISYVCYLLDICTFNSLTVVHISNLVCIFHPCTLWQ